MKSVLFHQAWLFTAIALTSSAPQVFWTAKSLPSPKSASIVGQRSHELRQQNPFVIYSLDVASPKAKQLVLTNSSMQVETIEGKSWLQLGAEGSFTFSNLIRDTLIKQGILRNKNLPDECTFEFDVWASDDYSWKTKELAVIFAATKQLKTDFRNWGENRYSGTGVKVGLHPIEFGDKDKGQTRMMIYKNGRETSKVEKIQRSFTIQQNRVHVKMIRQREQLQVYVNADKIWETTNAFDSKIAYNAILFTTGSFEGDNKVYIRDIKLSIPRG